MPGTVNPASASTLIPSAAGRSGDDPIFALNSEAKRRAAAGESVINATLGALMEDDGSLAVIPSVIEALARVPSQKAAAYAPISGDAKFLEAVIADVYGPGELAAQTVAAATPGGTGALYHALTNFLEPGQALLTTSYFWGPYQTIASHTGRRLETFEMFAPSGGFHLAAFEAALTRQLEQQGRALLFLNSPCHNPTGYSLDEREWEALAGIVQRAGERAPLVVLVDLAYARFGSKSSQSWTRHVPQMSSAATVLVAWSASKAFAQYGARVGALLATCGAAAERTRIANALSFACRGTWSNCNHLGLLAISELLSEPALRARADLERERLIRLLDERVGAFNREAARAGLQYPRYEGGFFVSVFTPEPEACAAKLREEGIFVVPLKGGAVRIALCSTPARDVPRLVAALGRATGR
ncbi:MAG: aminotransferase class I/II-fold pyridoxal phosphate-dependent enzyme [Planctomycetes bacterium]|nr:aminotransferase class I/II-fold pyridoxal phosphate-dependent enzyme [Planctomycetota bacterium]